MPSIPSSTEISNVVFEMKYAEQTDMTSVPFMHYFYDERIKTGPTVKGHLFSFYIENCHQIIFLDLENQRCHAS
jgi:hypothetical protein